MVSMRSGDTSVRGLHDLDYSEQWDMEFAVASQNMEKCSGAVSNFHVSQICGWGEVCERVIKLAFQVKGFSQIEVFKKGVMVRGCDQSFVGR